MGTAKRISVLLAGCITLTGCLGRSGPDCKDETRSLSARARLVSMASEPSPSDTGRAHVALFEARNYQSKSTSAQDVLWFVGSGLAPATVTSVHVHEQGTDRLLFTIPLDASRESPFVIARVFTRRPYSGPTNWNELYELIGSERTYVDVHTSDHPEVRLRGALHLEFPNWRTFTHAYCS